ncbi:uncharacterized protein LOC123683965 [Harmonia axyridis]|uniref:uncharacterized protein LOC123683965 n=1 Tax=Harmonia axyridis TaxID=115357 RepID=UPI001E278EEF|nr:uncharacterized protein LOC123683965 [Harmonia axyridis]
MYTENKKMVPPDGGWGWIVVAGVSMVNLCTRSIEQSFGLLFGDILESMGVETTGSALIMSALDALINFSGLLVGPLIRAFSFRKVSLAGALLCSIGLSATSPANNMGHILLSYSIINGLGVGLASSATFVALNNYFVKKRGQAVGLSLAGTAFGMMIMPQAIKLLLDAYAFRGAILVLGAFALNGVVGSCVLQPAEWHYVEERKTVQDGKLHKEMETIKETEDEEADIFEDQNLLHPKMNQDMIVVKTLEDLGKQSTLIRKGTFPRNFSTLSFVGSRKRKVSLESVMSSYSRLDFTGSSLQLHLETNHLPDDRPADNVPLRRNMSYPGVQPKRIRVAAPTPLSLEIKPLKKHSMWQKVVEFMDFDLLKDPIYLNLVFGLSMFYVAEQNFKMLTPFFFKSIGYDKQDVATFLSVQAATDILARLILPPICDRMAVSKRTLFMTAIFFLGLCRSVLAIQKEKSMILTWLAIAGFVRGSALINFAICISEYSTLEKLPAAFGLHNVGKGLFVVALGPLLGIIRDTTKSFPICLHSQTVLIMLCCAAWITEYIILYIKSRKKQNEPPPAVS